MENKKKKSRVTEFTIVAIILLAAALLVMEMLTRVSEEVNILTRNNVGEMTTTPTPYIMPTRDPSVTYEPIEDAFKIIDQEYEYEAS